MRKILFIITLCFLSTSLHAQNTFIKVIDTLGSDYAPCIQETFDGGYVYCGKSNYGGNDVIIVKLDSIGTVEWGKTYSGAGIEYATYIEQTPDSGYMVNAVYNSGLNGLNWLLRLDINGDTLWTKTFSVGVGATETGNGNSMASINNSLYGLSGYYLPPSQIFSAFFIASIGNGFQLASKIYNPSIYGAESRSIDKTYDDGFIMAGGVGTSASTADVYVIRTNTYGDTLWTRTYNFSQNDVAFDVKETTDSGFIVAGVLYDTTVYKNNIYLIKTDSAGDTLWTKDYFNPYHQVAYSIEQTMDGGYIITGTAMNSANERNAYLIKTDADGDTLWTRIFAISTNCFGLFVRQTKDGGFIISGHSNMPPGGTIIIKTDSMGMVNSGTGIAEVNNPFGFNVYPNPTAGIFTITAKGISKFNSSIKIYNLISECVYSGIISNNIPVQINLNNAPNGMYAITLHTYNKMYSQKIIIEK